MNSSSFTTFRLRVLFRRSTVLAVLVAAISGALPVYATVINDFDANLESWKFDFGASGSTISHDPSEGSPGNLPGAARLTFNFPGGGIAFTGDLFGTPTNLTGSPTLKFDVKVNTAASSLDAFGAYGFLQFVSRETDGYTWGNQSGINLPAVSGWQTFSVPTTGNGGLNMTATRALTLQIYGGPAQNIPGPVTLWLDNIRLVPEPASLTLLTLTASCILLSRQTKVQ